MINEATLILLFIRLDIRRRNVRLGIKDGEYFLHSVSRDSPSITRFRSEDGVSYGTDAAAMDSVCCFTTFQLGRCLLSEGLEAGPSGCRMISLLTIADSKASLIQQRQQRISVCKFSMWRLSQLIF